MSEASVNRIEKIKARIDEVYTDLERELHRISKTSFDSEDLKWWKEIYLLYGKISVLEGDHHADDQSLMYVEWEKMLKYINFAFCTGCKWCE